MSDPYRRLRDYESHLTYLVNNGALTQAEAEDLYGRTSRLGAQPRGTAETGAVVTHLDDSLVAKARGGRGAKVFEEGGVGRDVGAAPPVPGGGPEVVGRGPLAVLEGRRDDVFRCRSKQIGRALPDDSPVPGFPPCAWSHGRCLLRRTRLLTADPHLSFLNSQSRYKPSFAIAVRLTGQDPFVKIAHRRAPDEKESLAIMLGSVGAPSLNGAGPPTIFDARTKNIVPIV